ncbi:HNH endonuclease [Geobacillus phage vB_GthS_PK2.1]|nr:HNH endonuclease [Geobacillus phage vB_GthS_PK2.1]
MLVGIFDEANAVPKPNHKRRTPKRKSRGEFSQETIRAIWERDGYRCVKCGSYHLEKVPHHVIYKSQGGRGTKRNGATVCRGCHDWAHGLKPGPFGEPPEQGRKWFEEWVETHLDENGDLIRKGDRRGKIRDFFLEEWETDDHDL